jgi:hypothetical protein
MKCRHSNISMRRPCNCICPWTSLNLFHRSVESNWRGIQIRVLKQVDQSPPAKRCPIILKEEISATHPIVELESSGPSAQQGIMKVHKYHRKASQHKNCKREHKYFLKQSHFENRYMNNRMTNTLLYGRTVLI